MPLRLVTQCGRHSSVQIVRVVGKVLPWPLPPWKLHGASWPLCAMWSCVVNLPTEDVAAPLGMGHALRTDCTGRQRGRAVVSPVLGAPCVRRACYARCPCVWSLGVGDAPLHRLCGWSVRSCHGCSRPGSSTRRRVHCARCGCVWSTCPQTMSQHRSAWVTCSPHRLRRSSARLCHGFSRPGSSMRTSCPL
jgi:hypothetical protein